jgi:hypothetical protein
MLWVTRHTIRTNRSATAWLIRRFIDPAAVFRFVTADEVPEVQQRAGARGFDAAGATYPHRDERGRCSFEALVDEHCARDPALVELARIVHGADFAAELGYTPESAGLRAIAHGFPLVSRNDHDTLERATFVYDALYAHLRARHGGAP